MVVVEWYYGNGVVVCGGDRCAKWL